MRRQRGKRVSKFLYVSGGFLLFFIILFFVLYNRYNKKLEDLSKSMLSSEEIIGLSSNNEINNNVENNLREASSSLSQTITEALKQNEEENEIEELETTQEEETIEEKEEKEEETNATVENEVVEEKIVEEPKEEKKELEFSYPVEGEIAKDFSMETLVFSETLQEWTVHQGIDIVADRTTVVKAAERGTVSAIKNDPRYGLTVVIEHEDGFKTIYSNLLSTEFVEEGEIVEKGDSIGTVGNSAAFEIADEPHLHFEMTKDDSYVDPKIYLK